MASFVSFTSAHGGVGTTLVMTQVARRLADSGRRVLVIDLQVRTPHLHRCAEHGPRGGGFLPLVGEFAQTGEIADPRHAVRRWRESVAPPGELWVMASGPGPTEDELVAQIQALPDLARAFRQAVEWTLDPHYVLLDLGGENKDIANWAMGSLTDQAVMVLRPDARSIERTAIEGRQRLRNTWKLPITVVVNRVPAGAPEVVKKRIASVRDLFVRMGARRSQVVPIGEDPWLAVYGDATVRHPDENAPVLRAIDRIAGHIQGASSGDVYATKQRSAEALGAGRVGLALEALQQFSQEKPCDVLGHLALADVALGVGQVLEAHAALSCARWLAGDIGPVVSRLATLEEAAQALGVSLKTEQQVPADLQVALADQLVQSASFLSDSASWHESMRRAAQLYRTAMDRIEASDRHATLQNRLASVFHRLAMRLESEDERREMLQESRDLLESHWESGAPVEVANLLALVLVDSAQSALDAKSCAVHYDRALAVLGQVLEREPDRLECVELLSWILQERATQAYDLAQACVGEPRRAGLLEALRFLRKAQEQLPSEGLHFKQGNVLVELAEGRDRVERAALLREAVLQYQQEASREQNPSILVNLGFALSSLAALVPDSEQPLLLGQSRDVLRLAQSLEPDAHAIHVMLGEVLQRLGRHGAREVRLAHLRDAVHHYQAALALSPEDESILPLIGEVAYSVVAVCEEAERAKWMNIGRKVFLVAGEGAKTAWLGALASMIIESVDPRIVLAEVSALLDPDAAVPQRLRREAELLLSLAGRLPASHRAEALERAVQCYTSVLEVKEDYAQRVKLAQLFSQEALRLPLGPRIALLKSARGHCEVALSSLQGVAGVWRLCGLITLLQAQSEPDERVLWKEAARRFQKAEALQPHVADVELACIAAQMGDLDEAESRVRTVLAADPDQRQRLTVEPMLQPLFVERPGLLTVQPTRSASSGRKRKKRR